MGVEEQIEDVLELFVLTERPVGVFLVTYGDIVEKGFGYSEELEHIHVHLRNLLVVGFSLPDTFLVLHYLNVLAGLMEGVFVVCLPNLVHQFAVCQEELFVSLKEQLGEGSDFLLVVHLRLSEKGAGFGGVRGKGA